MLFMTSGNMDYSFTEEHSDKDSLTHTIATAIGSGIVGATIGQALSGRMGATVGAIVGGLAGMTLAKDTDNGITRLSTQMSEKAIHQIKSASKHLKAATEDSADELVDSFTHQAERVTLIHSEDEAEAPVLDEAPPLDEVVIPTEAHNQLGVFLGRHGDLNEAIREFQVALNRQPDSAVAHYNLGVALYKRGSRTLGLEHLRQAKRLCLQQGRRRGRKAVEYALRQLQPKSDRNRRWQTSIG
jgi:Flp pilus assembly protein TadD